MYYKMKAILLFALSIIMLSQSYGFAYAATISVTTDSLSYETGDLINISGSISDYDESDPYQIYDVTIRLIAPNNNIINISQVSPNSDGSYSTFILAEGKLWKFEGEYTVSVGYGSDINASTTFTFISEPEEEVIEEEVIEGEAIEVMLEEELAKGCGPGTHLEDGICVLDETTVEPAFVSTGSVPTVGSTSLFYSITFTVLIAFAIMIVLYLISRGSRTKTA